MTAHTQPSTRWTVVLARALLSSADAVRTDGALLPGHGLGLGSGLGLGLGLGLAVRVGVSVSVRVRVGVGVGFRLE